MNQPTLFLCQQTLSNCKTVKQWNQEVVNLTKLGMTREIRAAIESSGLIVKTLGVDEGQPVYSK